MADGTTIPTSACESGCGCVTCGDVAEPLRVHHVDAAAQLATCAGGQIVDTGVMGRVLPGDVLLVHAGVAIARLGPGEETG